MCECPFCTYVPPLDTLPVPVCIPIHPQPHFAAWGWLTYNDGLGRIGIDIVRGSSSHTFFDHLEMVRHLTTHFPPGDYLVDANVRRSANDISVRLSEHECVPISAFQRIPIGFTDTMPPFAGRIECTSRAPRAQPNDSSSSSTSTASRRNNAKRRRKNPPSSGPPRSPTRDAGTTYDVKRIGGDPYEMQRIAESGTMWDAELVNYIIERGARPPLVSVTGGTALDLFCSFRAPNGSLVHNVSVPRAIMALMYGRTDA